MVVATAATAEALVAVSRELRSSTSQVKLRHIQKTKWNTIIMESVSLASWKALKVKRSTVVHGTCTTAKARFIYRFVDYGVNEQCIAQVSPRPTELKHEQKSLSDQLHQALHTYLNFDAITLQQLSSFFSIFIRCYSFNLWTYPLSTIV